jgi:uncharacterized protein YbjQ (UPF0145 family)
MNKSLPVSTGSNIHGVDINETIGFVSSHVIAATNIFSDIFASFSDIFGGRSQTYKKQLTAIKNEAVQELMNEAAKVGGNAIVAMSIDLDEVSGSGKSMFMITATGTAVKISAPAQSQKTGENTSSIDASELDDLVFKQHIISLASTNELEFTEEILKRIIELNIFEIRDCVLEYILRYIVNDSWEHVYESSEAAYLKQYIAAYFSIVPLDLAIESLYKNLGINLSFNNVILKVIKENFLFDYEKTIALLSSSDVDSKKIAVELLTYNKLSYTEKDIKMHEDLASALELNIQKISKVYEIKKMMGTKNVWKCVCNKEIDHAYDSCPVCGRNIYGMDNYNFRDVKILIEKRLNALRVAF